MKKILFLLFAAISINVFAEESNFVQAAKQVHQDVTTVASTLYGDSKEAVTALYPEVKSAIFSLAQAMGVAAEHLYSVLVKKFVVDGIIQLIPFSIGLILLIIGCIKLDKYMKGPFDQIRWRILYPLSFLIVSIIMLCIVNYQAMLMGLINPEFGAINYILDFTKSMVS